jgi:hypothetical protein
MQSEREVKVLSQRPWGTLIRMLVPWIVVACAADGIAAFLGTTFLCNPVRTLKPDILLWRAELDGMLIIPAALLIGGIVSIIQWRVLKLRPALLARSALALPALCLLVVVLYWLVAARGAVPENCPF